MLGEAVVGGVGRGFRPIGGISLVEDVVYVGVYRPGAQDQLLRDFTITSTQGDEAKYLYFALS